MPIYKGDKANITMLTNKLQSAARALEKSTTAAGDRPLLIEIGAESQKLQHQIEYLLAPWNNK